MGGTPAHKRNIGVVFQSYALFPHMSVFDNVAFGLKMRHVPKADIAQRIARVLDLVKLSGFDERFPKQLSGGQQQRVAVARALVVEPSILLLDEPLSNLDANLREQMRFEIREIQKRIGITTIFVTHDQQEAMAAADWLVIMSKGRVRQIGTPQEIYETPVDDFVTTFIGQCNHFSGTVTDIQGGKATLKLDSGDRVVVQARGTIKKGEPARLAVRPAVCDISVTPKPGFNAVPAKVVHSTYLGNNWQVAMRVGNDAIMAITTAQAPPDDASVFVVWHENTGTLLPQTSSVEIQ